MDGPGSNLDLVLDAASFSDLSDRLEFVDAVNASDASLAQEVANVGYELGLDEARLARAEGPAGGARGRRRGDGGADPARAPARGGVEGAAGRRGRGVRRQVREDAEGVRGTPREHQRWLALERPDARRMGGCPRGVPRRHAARVRRRVRRARGTSAATTRTGVSTSSPPRGRRSTRPFDGVATDATNSLGGIAVKVTGKYGYVYNAHLSRSPSSVPSRRGRHRLRQQHRPRGWDHAPRPLRVLAERDPGELARELLRLQPDRRRDQPVPAARRRLRLSTARR